MFGGRGYLWFAPPLDSSSYPRWDVLVVAEPDTKDWQTPPIAVDPSGAERTVGVEIEFTSLDVARTSAIVAEVFGGRVETPGRFEHVVVGTELGDFTVELDARALKQGRYLDLLESLGLTPDRDVVGWIEEAIEATAGLVVPCEIISPPIGLSKLPALDRLIDRLREAHAAGTHKGAFYAFGLHLNPRVPAETAQSLLDHMRAFMLLKRWIVASEEIDLTRRLTPFIRAFPGRYRRLVLNTGYRPDLERLIRDYLRHNPSRNRPLDMHPVFAFLRPELVGANCAEPELLNPRPTYHYRLPDSRVDDPDWSIAEAWNDWVEVERLADDTERLLALCDRAQEAM